MLTHAQSKERRKKSPLLNRANLSEYEIEEGEEGQIEGERLQGKRKFIA